MSALTDFLLARIEEEERGARGLVAQYDSLVAGLRSTRLTMYLLGPHFGRWAPARVLTECASKRQIVELHSTPEERRTGQPCTTLRLLALPYAEHPDYRVEWSA